MAATQAYKSKLSVGGASTGFTGAACTLVSGKTYQLNGSTFRVLDPNTVRTWKDNGVSVAAANIASEDLLFGKVTFAAGYSVTGPVTLDASYIPRAVVGAVKSGTIDESTANDDTTPINSSGYHQRTQTLQDVKVDITVTDDLNTDLDPGAATTSFRSALRSRTPLLYEFDGDGANTNVFRTWLVLDSGKTTFDPAHVTMGQVSGSLNAQGNANALAGASWGAP